MDLQTELARRSGPVPTHHLLRLGARPRDLSAAVLSGSLVRVRQGWYALPDEDAPRTRAWRIGGVMTCHSGAADHGLWLRDDLPDNLHVLVAPNSARLRSPHDMRQRDPGNAVVHWRRATRSTRSFTASALDCLVDLAGCDAPDFVVAAADSAIRKRLVTTRSWRAEVDGMPAGRHVLKFVDPKSESIVESVTRVRLRLLGISHRIQVPLAPRIRVDFLLGSRLVIEVDGREFHSDSSQFERDRRRDAELRRLGYRVLRFSYAQVMHQWHLVEATILAALLSGDHIRP